jgi:hypothetical protein
MKELELFVSSRVFNLVFTAEERIPMKKHRMSQWIRLASTFWGLTFEIRHSSLFGRLAPAYVLRIGLRRLWKRMSTEK